MLLGNRDWQSFPAEVSVTEFGAILKVIAQF